MSDVGDERAVQKTLECNVCLCNYNQSDKLPKALRCQHTFCDNCVNNLLQGRTELSCPKCRSKTNVADILTNFAVLDIIGVFCEDCNSKEKSTECNHCNKARV